MGVQVVPPSAVRSRRGPVAAAKPSWSFTKCRATKALVVPLVWRVQVAPPSVVRATLPPSLAAQPSWSSDEAELGGSRRSRRASQW